MNHRRRLEKCRESRFMWHLTVCLPNPTITRGGRKCGRSPRRARCPPPHEQLIIRPMGWATKWIEESCARKGDAQHLAHGGGVVDEEDRRYSHGQMVMVPYFFSRSPESHAAADWPAAQAASQSSSQESLQLS